MWVAVLADDLVLGEVGSCVVVPLMGAGCPYASANDLTQMCTPGVGRACSHYHGAAGKALPAILVGLVARVGSTGGQRLALPLAFVRADTADPSSTTHARLLVREAVRQCAPDDVLVLDAGFSLALLQTAGASRYVVRLAKNATFRRATPPPYGGRGRPPTRGTVVRPLSRVYQGRPIPATPPDQRETWAEGDTLLRAEVWAEVVLPEADTDADSATCTVVAIHDPRYREPLLLATALTLTPQQVRDCYRDRWPVEQLPLAAKQMVGAARQFVHAPETCQRLPEVALLAGSVLSYAAATPPRRPHGLLGSPATPDPRSAPPLLGAATLSPRLPPPGAHPRKSHGHQPSPHRLLGPTPRPSLSCLGSLPRSGRLSYRKLEVKSS